MNFICSPFGAVCESNMQWWHFRGSRIHSYWSNWPIDCSIHPDAIFLVHHRNCKSADSFRMFMKWMIQLSPYHLGCKFRQHEAFEPMSMIVCCSESAVWSSLFQIQYKLFLVSFLLFFYLSTRTGTVALGSNVGGFSILDVALICITLCNAFVGCTQHKHRLLEDKQSFMKLQFS